MKEKKDEGAFNALMTLLTGCLIYVGWLGIKQDFGEDYFNKITGTIQYFGNKHELRPNLSSTKYRFIGINNYEKIFQIFIGKGSMDFKPAYEKLDFLKAGDVITVYYENDYSSPELNQLVYFIDRGEQKIFVKGDSKQQLEYMVEGLILIVMAFFFYLKRKGRMQ